MFRKLKGKMGGKDGASAQPPPPPQQQQHRPAAAAGPPSTAAAALRSQPAANPAQDARKRAALAEQEKRLAEMKNKIENIEKNKKLLKDEDLKLQRIEEQLRAANVELLKVKDSKDASKRNSVIAKVKRLRQQKQVCENMRMQYQGFVDTLQDQINAATTMDNVHGFKDAAKPMVDENELIETMEDAKEAVQNQNFVNEALLNATLSDNMADESELEDLYAMAEEQVGETLPDHIGAIAGVGKTPSDVPRMPGAPQRASSVEDELRQMEKEIAG